jgi:DNA polymerase III subunit delta
MIYKSYLIEGNIDLLKENIILFYGENLGLKDDLKNKIKNSKKEASILVYNQDDILKNEDFFFNEILNVSLFEEKKIFFINEATDKILNIIENIRDKIDNHEIFLFSEILEKKSKIRNYFEKDKKLAAVACYNDNEITIKKIIQERLKGFTGLSSQNINTLIENCDLDRSKLKNELEKIIIFFSDKKINDENLDELLNIKENNNFNSLKDEAMNGNKIKTNKLLGDTIFEKEKNILYINLINQRLMKLSALIEMTKLTNIDKAINEIKPSIFWKDKPFYIAQIKKWNSQKIKNILNSTFNLEVTVKSNSSINHDLLIKKLMVDICNLANV